MSHRLEDYNFEFPSELVAQEPLRERDASRMMVLSPQAEEIHHGKFKDLPDQLRDGDLLVVNDTSVIPARLFAQKESGGKVEVFLLRSLEGLVWHALVSPARGLRAGTFLQILLGREEKMPGWTLEVLGSKGEGFRVRFPGQQVLENILKKAGEMPLPPYIKRKVPRLEDKSDYQTLFASQPGAVAAPTAGLHFTPALREHLLQRGIDLATVTLHVGGGTFLPIRTQDIREHSMHEEWYRIGEATLDKIESCKKRGGRVVAVGTTTLRALESYAQTGKSQAWTNLFISPGFEFQAVDLLLTNFHQPQSTLFILVSALAGRQFMMRAYEEAMERAYRLFSYGDCMLIRAKTRWGIKK